MTDKRNQIENDAAGCARLHEVAFTLSAKQGIAATLLADAIVSSFFFAVEPSTYGLFEDAYGSLSLQTGVRHPWTIGMRVFLAPLDTLDLRC